MWKHSIYSLYMKDHVHVLQYQDFKNEHKEVWLLFLRIRLLPSYLFFCGKDSWCNKAYVDSIV